MKYNENIGDWIVRRNFPEAEVAWLARHPRQYWLAAGLFKFHWKNPRPELKIKTIRLESYEKAMVALVAITGGT